MIQIMFFQMALKMGLLTFWTWTQYGGMIVINQLLIGWELSN